MTPQSLSISIRLLVSTTSIQLLSILPKKQKSFQELTKNPLVNAKMENMSKIIDTPI